MRFLYIYFLPIICIVYAKKLSYMVRNPGWSNNWCPICNLFSQWCSIYKGVGVGVGVDVILCTILQCIIGAVQCLYYSIGLSPSNAFY